VECDPSRTELSAALAASLSLNFKPYGTKVIGFRNALPQLKEPTERIWTIKRAIFTDQRQGGSSRFIDLWCSNGTVKRLTVEAAARLQGFPNWYYLPESINVAGSLLGYSVPPHFAQQLYSL
jgi:site-specific DNA-cytosine methylase